MVTGAGSVMNMSAVSAGLPVSTLDGIVALVSEEMKVVCFFAPPTNLENYRMHEGVDFPD